MENRQTVMVTGAAGYIGSVLVGRLLGQGYRVRGLDNLSFGGNGLLPYMGNTDFDFIQGDITSADDLAGAIEGVDAVVHLAAIVGDPACRRQPDLAEKVNRAGAELLCATARESGVRRFVFASTCSNYGKMETHDGYVEETSPLKPVSLYAELKVGFEEHLMALACDEFVPVVLRFATAYGLSPRPRFDLTVNEFTRELVLGRPLEIYGEHFWRPYAHTTDLAAACSLALRADAAAVAGEAFNVGATDENYQKKTLVRMILEHLPRMADQVTFVARDEDPRDYRVRFEKIKTGLGFEPHRTVPDGIKEIIKAIRLGIIPDPDDRRYGNL